MPPKRTPLGVSHKYIKIIIELLLYLSGNDFFSNLIFADTEGETIRSVDWYILPILNPDGYEYSHEYDRMWRKTRSRHEEKQDQGFISSALSWFQPTEEEQSFCSGVDLNRNWGHRWNEDGASKYVCSDFYSGYKAFSEPEAKALSKFLMKKKKTIDLYLSLHSYGQFLTYHVNENVMDDDVYEMASVGIQALRGSGSSSDYRIDRKHQMLYKTSGTSTEYARNEVGIKYSYTLELPDTGTHGFLFPPSNIESTARDAFEIIKGMVEYI